MKLATVYNILFRNFTEPATNNQEYLQRAKDRFIQNILGKTQQYQVLESDRQKVKNFARKFYMNPELYEFLCGRRQNTTPLGVDE